MHYQDLIPTILLNLAPSLTPLLPNLILTIIFLSFQLSFHPLSPLFPLLLLPLAHFPPSPLFPLLLLPLSHSPPFLLSFLFHSLIPPPFSSLSPSTLFLNPRSLFFLPLRYHLPSLSLSTPLIFFTRISFLFTGYRFKLPSLIYLFLFIFHSFGTLDPWIISRNTVNQLILENSKSSQN